MRLIVKKGDRTIEEFRFGEGPIYIGRLPNSQVFLPEGTVSRQHAVIFISGDGKWIVEDLDSANQTYLNEKAIHKSEIKTGDRLRISDFTLEVYLEDETETDKPTHLEDTLVTASASRGPQIIVRRPDADHAPEIKLPAKRVKDFMEATEAICKAKGPDKLLQVLLGVMLRQFGGYRSWCALRNESTGPMTSHAGKSREGETVALSDININDQITQAVEKGQFLLLPQVSGQVEGQRIRSAMIAPIMDPTGCFGALYVDNSADHEQYTLSDLDYLMLLAISTAAILENF
ncbi:MAG: FHA domain-containing protein [Phycisphaerae bacterium]|nr:FHA domain-containing protein [Phycisphaerae bacterium]NIP51531.1 FHA domain-containing protein [Phycisphaerae bacterium]NIS49708.1 FHA domain-containing protein [Phycisphaerae bacterium]NIU07440.1 FHA domain-containing protein [Phycisphaerae bacterium]NIU55027.1 FHA domain-containing protein [Phycisphaerae bacterium]